MELDFEQMLDDAETGKGADWISVPDLYRFCDYILAQGYGVQTMEAKGARQSVPRAVRFQILGVEGEETWENHRDPKRSIDLVRETVRNAQREGHEMLYKVWVQKP